MLKTILVPLDGSVLAEVALGYAAELSIPTGARLLLVRVANSHMLPGIDSRERKQAAIWEAEQYLTHTAANLMGRGYACDAVVPYGNAVDGLLEQARLSNANLIVMSTHGRTGPGRLLVGSVAESIVARSTLPVLLTRASLPAHPDALLKEDPLFIVPLDGSAFAESVLQPAIQLAEDLGAGLLLLTAQPTDAPPVEELDYLSTLEARLRGTCPDLTIDVGFRYGTASQAIQEAYLESGASLVIMATHGRTGVLRSLAGSVAGQVLKAGSAPLVLVRPPAYVEQLADKTDASMVGTT